MAIPHNVRSEIADAVSEARFEIATVLSVELMWSHQGAAEVSIWANRDSNILEVDPFPEHALSEREVNFFTIPNQENLTFRPESGDKVTIDGILYFVKMSGVIGDFDSGFQVIVSRRSIKKIGVPS